VQFESGSYCVQMRRAVQCLKSLHTEDKGVHTLQFLQKWQNDYCHVHKLKPINCKIITGSDYNKDKKMCGDQLSD
jgi:hypothetical protein